MYMYLTTSTTMLRTLKLSGSSAICRHSVMQMTTTKIARHDSGDMSSFCHMLLLLLLPSDCPPLCCCW
jgi:hypothetical protein